MRQEARRQLSEHHGTLWRRLCRAVNPATLAIWVGFYAIAVTILVVGGDSMPRYRNELVQNDIVARVGFQVEDTERTQQERQAAAINAPDVYVENPAPLASLRSDLTELLATVKAAAEDPGSQLLSKGWAIGEAGLAILRDYASDELKSSDYEGLVKRLLTELGGQYLVHKPAKTFREGTPQTSVLRRKDAKEAPDIEILTSRLQYVGDEKAIDQMAAEVADRVMPESLRGPVRERIRRTLAGAPEKSGTQPQPVPLWRYDQDATKEMVKQAQDRVPVYTLRYEAGDPIVRARTVLSPQKIELLKKEHQEFRRAQRTDPALYRQRWLGELGKAIIILVVTFGLITYIVTYQQRIFQKPARALGLAALLLVLLLCTRLLNQIQSPAHSPAEFTLAFVATAAMLLTIAYNQRFAFGTGGTLAILATLASGGDFGLFLTLTVGMSVAVFALHEVRTRSKIVLVGLMTAAASFLAATAVGFYDAQDVKYVLEHAAAAALAALFAGFFVQGILPTFERWFGIATSMTLLEWCDASRPLLRRLAQEAPGTYSHSLVLSQMSEAAAGAIGANGLLARVGALYHDIGKVQKTEYFVENQEARMNRHDRLSPTMSLLIITGHVKDGLEMAKAYGLPRVLHQFILEHHGTTVVRYFHHMATEAAARKTGKHDREVSESEFRYPGPKPRSRESAILMICDGCEGAVRALSEPTPGRIESTVHQVVMDRLTDGQFDECDITLRDLNLVEQTIVKSLCAIHHGRIKYPKAGGNAPRAAAQPELRTLKPPVDAPHSQPAPAAPPRTEPAEPAPASTAS